MFTHTLKISLRNLSKYKLQNLISIIALAVGIVTLTATHFIVKHMGAPAISEEAYYDRCYVMELADINSPGVESATDNPPAKNMSFGDVSYRITDEILSALTAGGNLPGVEKMFDNLSVTGGYLLISRTDFLLPDSTERTGKYKFYLTDPDRLQHFGIRSALTGEKLPVLNDKEVFISELQAREVFGEQNPVGCTLTMKILGGVYTLTVRDVIKNEKMIDDVNNYMFVYLKDEPDGGRYASELLIQLSENATLEAVHAEINRRLEPFSMKARIRTLRDVHAETVGVQIVSRNVVYAISALILVAALIGFLKMQLQLFSMRQREVALRRVHGASKRSIFMLFFCEVALILILAFGTAWLFAQWLSNYAETYMMMFLSELGWEIEGIYESVTVISLITFLICILVIGISTRRQLRQRQGMAIQLHKNRKHTLRNTMLGVQFVISITFLGGTLSLTQFVNRMMESYNVPENDDFYAECIQVSPFVKEDAPALREYLRSGANEDIQHYFCVEDREFLPIEEVSTNPELVEELGRSYWRCLELSDTSYFAFWQRPIHWFLPPEERHNCLLLTDTLYSELDKRGITDSGVLHIPKYVLESYRIGGTYAIAPYTSSKWVTALQEMAIIKDGTQQNGIEETLTSGEFIIVPREGKYNKVFTDLTELMARINPKPVNPVVMNLREQLAAEISLLENVQRGAWILTSICAIICLMGIWSSISLDTRSRQKEVAIRKVHGAKRKDIILLFGRLYLWLIAVAGALSILPLLLFNRLVQDMAVNEEISPDLLSPVPPILISLSLTILIVIFIVGHHIRDVMKVNPAEMIAKE
ncbi:MAG: ABC transporter permease [Bacteroidaceae bacterium]|nr:ABC transporter permease [Bacteroidaceae bacterium]